MYRLSCEEPAAEPFPSESAESENRKLKSSPAPLPTSASIELPNALRASEVRVLLRKPLTKPI